MDWNDPDNISFPICLLKRNSKRVDRVWRQIVGVEFTNVENPSGDIFGWYDDWTTSFAFDFSLWRESRTPVGDTTDTEVSGPRFRTVPGGYTWDINAKDPYGEQLDSILSIMIEKKVVPEGTTYAEICSAMQSQLTTTDPTDYQAGDQGAGRYYKQAFGDFCLSKGKLMWESLPPINPKVYNFLVYGRLPLTFNPGTNLFAYQPLLYWIQPNGETYKAYSIPCKGGCCCCCC